MERLLRVCMRMADHTTSAPDLLPTLILGLELLNLWQLRKGRKGHLWLLVSLLGLLIVSIIFIIPHVLWMLLDDFLIELERLSFLTSACLVGRAHVLSLLVGHDPAHFLCRYGFLLVCCSIMLWVATICVIFRLIMRATFGLGKWAEVELNLTNAWEFIDWELLLEAWKLVIALGIVLEKFEKTLRDGV